MNEEQFETAGPTAPIPAAEPGAPSPHPGGTETAATAARREETPIRRPARLGTIVWGLLVTAFAVVAALTTDLVPIEDPTAWLIGGLVVGGAALLVAGIAASLRRAD